MLFPACIQIKKKKNKNLLQSTELRKKGRGAKMKREMFSSGTVSIRL